MVVVHIVGILFLNRVERFVFRDRCFFCILVRYRHMLVQWGVLLLCIGIRVGLFCLYRVYRVGGVHILSLVGVVFGLYCWFFVLLSCFLRRLVVGVLFLWCLFGGIWNKCLRGLCRVFLERYVAECLVCRQWTMRWLFSIVICFWGLCRKCRIGCVRCLRIWLFCSFCFFR